MRAIKSNNATEYAPLSLGYEIHYVGDYVASYIHHLVA